MGEKIGYDDDDDKEEDASLVGASPKTSSQCPVLPCCCMFANGSPSPCAT